MGARFSSATNFSTYEGFNDPLTATPGQFDAWGSLFREGALKTLGRSAIDRTFLENGWSPFGAPTREERLSIDQANQEYGLALKPTQTKTISRSLAEYFSRKQTQHVLDQAAVNQYQPNIAESFASGLASSVTDPAEFLINLIPIGKVAKFGLGLAGRTGENAAARWAARAAGSPLLENPWLSGVIEGSGQTLLSAPLTSQNVTAAGITKYGLDDALMDVAVGGLAGGILQGGLHTLLHGGKAAMSGKWRPDLSDVGQDIQSGHTSFANGENINLGKNVDRQQLRLDLETARRDITNEILRSSDSAPPTLSDIEKQAYDIELNDTLATVSDTSGVLNTIPKKVGDQFSAHGHTGNLESLSKLLNEGIDPNRDFYTGTLAAPEGGTSYGVGTRESTFILVGEKGQPLDATHPPKYVIVADKYAGNVQSLEKHFPSIEFITKDEAARRFTDIAEGRALSRTVSPITPEVLESPEVQRHLSPLEKRLSLLNDQEGMQATVAQHAETINRSLAKWAELVSLPKAQQLENYSDIVALQNEVLSNVAQLNELIPSIGDQLPGNIPLTTQGTFRKDALTRLGTSIKALNDLALSHVDDTKRIEVLKAEWNRLRTDLKTAETSHAQARTKGLSTETVHAKRIAELTPQLQHVEALLRASGEAVSTPELSLGNYIMAALGGEVNPQLDAFLKQAPDSLDHPVYRVRKQIFDNVMRRLYETQEYLKATEPGSVNVSKFPENNVILQDVRRQLEGTANNIEPEKLHEELFQRVNQEISQQKALGIFDQSQLDRFDKIEEQFKENVAKTDAVKKGAAQAQICALGGIEA